MAETLFIGDECDIRSSIVNVISATSVVFIQQKRWGSPQVVASRDLSEFAELCRVGLSFFVFRAPESTKMKEVQIQGGPNLWEFDYRGTTGWIMVEAGGVWERNGVRKWVPGRVRANLSDESEREFYSLFKRFWLKGYKKGADKIQFGPSASRTLIDQNIANW
jgi:hypothetical protein